MGSVKRSSETHCQKRRLFVGPGLSVYRSLRWLACPILVVACDDGGATGPGTPPAPAQVAVIRHVDGRVGLWIQNADGSGARQIHFNGAAEMPGNRLDLPPITDANIAAIFTATWSPDGRRLAVVLSMQVMQQTEVIVVNADGSDARVASPNDRQIRTRVDWSPDGTRIAYLVSAWGVMSDTCFASVTDLTANTWRKLSPVSLAPGLYEVDVRWNAAGTHLFAWRPEFASSPDVEPQSRISTIDVQTGSVSLKAGGVPGLIYGVARDGSWAATIRYRGGRTALTRRSIGAAGTEQVLADTTRLIWAHLSNDDRSLLLMSTGYAQYTIPSNGGRLSPLTGVDSGIYFVDVLYR